MPPPSSGGVAVLQMLQGAELLNVGQYEHNSTNAVHLMAEIERRVFADRSKHLGDPDYFEVPVQQLLSPDYNASRFANISIDQTTPSADIQGGEVPYESPETTHTFHRRC